MIRITVSTNGAGPASSTPTLCINTPLSNITHATTSATGIGAPTGLPAGVTAAWASNTITISGTPTVSGTFNYSILVIGACGTANVNTTGTITVTPAMTASAASSTPSLCINTPLSNITHTTTGATGIGTATGLPGGVTAAWASNTVTISGTPTASGTFNYTIPLAGGCGSVNATGTITVNPNKTASAASSAPSLCVNTPLTNITHTTIGATGIGTAIGLPAGITASWSSNTITISGTPTASGTFNYSIPLTGCGSAANATGTIISSAAVHNVGAASSTQTLCINTLLTNITHTTTGATGIGTATGLPAGVTAAWANNTITINGMPTASGTFNYSIPLTGGCGNVNATGTITVNPLPALSANAGGASTVCINATTPAFTNAQSGGTWSIVNGEGTATVAGGVVTGLSAGSVSLVYTYSNGVCSNSVSSLLFVNPNNASVIKAPTMSAGGPTTFCSGSNVVLTAANPAVTDLSFTTRGGGEVTMVPTFGNLLCPLFWVQQRLFN